MKFGEVGFNSFTRSPVRMLYNRDCWAAGRRLHLDGVVSLQAVSAEMDVDGRENDVRH